MQNPVQGLYFLIFVIILQQVDGNIIGPKILGDSTGLSSSGLCLQFSYLAVCGAFLECSLGVPIMAVIYYIVSNVVTYSLKKRGIPATEIDYVNLDRIDKHTNQPVYETTEKNKKQDEKSAGEA
ncbi:MAG: AI-2E family transporter [Roseburia inulinivorans]